MSSDLDQIQLGGLSRQDFKRLSRELAQAIDEVAYEDLIERNQ